jgi:hypothetical protein
MLKKSSSLDFYLTSKQLKKEIIDLKNKYESEVEVEDIIGKFIFKLNLKCYL